jgi:hypothetical protein
MDIQVKFRDEEKLQRLSATRQSGGERAVATILYIMALQVRASAACSCSLAWRAAAMQGLLWQICI